MTIELGVLIAVIGIVLSAATFFIGRQSATKNAGMQEGRLQTDVEYIKKSVERIESRMSADVDYLRGRIDEQSGQLLTIGGIAEKGLSNARSAHKRIDEHLRREHDMTVEEHYDK